jgi:hypothetical protein
VRHQYPISAVPHDTPRLPLGPHALPGDYTVRLTVNGKTFIAPLTVKMDPRVKTPPAGLQQMFNLETGLAALLTSSSEVVIQARSIREQVDKLSGKASGSTAESIEAFKKKLKMLTGIWAVFSPGGSELTLSRVNGDVSTLYGEVYRADAAPTVAQVEAAKAAERDAATVQKQWDAFKTTDVPALNNALRGAGLQEIRLEANPQAAAEQGDEE